MDSSCCPDCCGTGYGSLPAFWLNPKDWIKLGDGLAWDGDTLNVTIVGGSDYVLPTASKDVKGGFKVGHSLMMIDDTLNVALDTVPSTVEGFVWIHDIVTSVSGGS